MAIKIPAADKAKFEKLLKLGRERVEQLAEELEETTPHLRLSKLLTDLGERVKIERSDLRVILRMLYSMHVGLLKQGSSPEKFAKEIIEGNRDLIDEDNSEWFEASLRGLLQNESVFVPAHKALALPTEVPNSFESARVITDVRPVFQDDLKNGIAGLVVTHSLRITYGESGFDGDREFFVGLTSSEISELRSHLDRALKKAKILEEVLEVELLNL